MRSIRFFAALIVATLIATPSEARLYNWTFTDTGGDSGAGTLTTDDTGPPSLMTATTGLFNGDPITGVAPIGTFGGNNNKIYDTGPLLLDFGGIAFFTVNTTYNLYYDNKQILLQGLESQPRQYRI